MKLISLKFFLTTSLTSNLIHYKHLTGINHYPVLSFLQETLPQRLLRIIEAQNIPLIYENCVFEGIKKFALETGNSHLISSIYHSTSGVVISSSFNQEGQTTVIKVQEGTNSRESVSVFSQSQENYEDDTLRFDLEAQEFHYAPVQVPFQTSLEYADWTCLSKRKSQQTLRGFLYQYPNLNEVILQGHRDITINNRFTGQWIQKVARQNPDCKGFLLYQYNFLSDPSLHFFFCGNPGELVSRRSPTPYLRFLDIKNVSNGVIQIESLQAKYLRNHPYQLTNVSNRSSILRHVEPVEEEVNIQLLPGHTALIPIEFGFDTKSHFKFLEDFEDINFQGKEAENLEILVSKPVLEEVAINFNHSKYWESPADTNQRYLTDLVTLPKSFLDRTRTLEDIWNSCPRRFAVGTFLDIQSIKINKKVVPVNPPNDSSNFSMSAYFQYGSCPYLLVYDHQKSYWIEKGVVLYGKANHHLESEETYSISCEISKIKLEEREPEITYLKSVALFYFDTRLKLECKVECLPLSINDSMKGYYLLREGESFEVVIKDLLPETASNIQLKIIGYYDILKSLPDLSSS